jgi:hypothetical protein
MLSGIVKNGILINLVEGKENCRDYIEDQELLSYKDIDIKELLEEEYEDGKYLINNSKNDDNNYIICEKIIKDVKGYVYNTSKVELKVLSEYKIIKTELSLLDIISFNINNNKFIENLINKKIEE